MSFIWPPVLLSLLLVPIGLLVYRYLDRRRGRLLAVYGSTAAGRAPKSRTVRIRSRIPAILTVCGVVVMMLALARPQAVVSLPREEGTIVLAFDVSASMGATDMTPTRIAAAKVAAKDFVAKQPPTVSIGVVAFSDSGISVQTPTNDQGTVDAAIDRLAPQKGTSLGEGILTSLKVIAVAEAGPWVDYYTNASPAPSVAPTPTPVPAGYHAPAAIVLLTDGENNENPDPVAAAQAAANAGVRIYTVGVGTTAGTTVNLNGFQVHTQMNQAGLQQIADLTGGNFYGAANADQLKSVYDNLDTQLVTPAELTELTGIFAGASVLLLLAGVAASLAWLGRMP